MVSLDSVMRRLVSSVVFLVKYKDQRESTFGRGKRFGGVRCWVILCHPFKKDQNGDSRQLPKGIHSGQSSNQSSRPNQYLVQVL